MVMPSSLYATICAQDGRMLANHVEAQETEVADADGFHRVITALLTQGQSARVTVGTTYLIGINNIKGNPRPYTLILSEDERLPLRRHTFRSEVGS